MIDLSVIQNAVIRSPAEEHEIYYVEQKMETTLPMVFREFLLNANGLSIGGGLLFYGTEEIIERNLIWEVREYAVDYIAVGDDGGGSVFLMANDIDTKELLSVDSGDMNPNNGTVITSDFLKWLSDGCPISDKIVDMSYTEECDIVLTDTPDGGAKDVVRIKNILGVDIPIGVILKGLKSPPFRIVKSISYGKALKRLEKLGNLNRVLRIVKVSDE